MADERIRQHQRSADTLRGGSYMMRLLEKYNGKRIYIEGARMNYLATLEEATPDPDGNPACLIVTNCKRVGEWRREGPREQYTMNMSEGPAGELPRVIPWQAVDEFGLSPWGEKF